MKTLLRTLILLLLSTSCGHTSWFGQGYYGPFTLTIKSQDGEPVEDVIVRLSKITVGTFGRSDHTYREKVVASTDEKIKFPRGFVTKYKSDTILLNFSISHPYYRAKEHYVHFVRKEKGEIDLGVQIIATSENLAVSRKDNLTSIWTKQGLSALEVEEKLKKGITLPTPILYLHSALRRYFKTAVEMGRQDLVDKYYPSMVQQAIDEEGITDSEKRMLKEEEYKKEFEKWLKL